MPGRISPKTLYKNVFGPQLKIVRQARGVTATAVISKLRGRGWIVGHSTYSSLEAGNRILADTELILILEILEVDFEVLRLPKVTGKGLQWLNRQIE